MHLVVLAASLDWLSHPRVRALCTSRPLDSCARRLFPPCTMLQVKCPEEYAEFQEVNGIHAEHHRPHLKSLSSLSMSQSAHDNEATTDSIATAESTMATEVARSDALSLRCSASSKPRSFAALERETTRKLFDAGRSHAVRSRWHKTFYKAVHEPNAKEALARVERETLCRFSHIQVLPTFV